MEVSPAAVLAYETAVPDDPRVARKRMFGTPCAFVNRQMFFGTFGDTVIARVGPERAEELAQAPGRRIFAPMEGRPWRDYVQVAAQEDPAVLKGLATEALAWTEDLPPKLVTPKSEKKAKKIRKVKKTD